MGGRIDDVLTNFVPMPRLASSSQITSSTACFIPILDAAGSFLRPKHVSPALP
jgi:hypothetical protein